MERSEMLIEEIKSASKDPESIDESLRKVKEVILIIEEVIELIEIIESVVLIIRGRCRGQTAVVKEIERKTMQVRDFCFWNYSPLHCNDYDYHCKHFYRFY